MGNEIRCGVLSTNVYNKMVYNLTIDRITIHTLYQNIVVDFKP